MRSCYIYLLIISLTLKTISTKGFESNLPFIFPKLNDNTNSSSLRDWLGKLVIDIPNELIKEETDGLLEDLTIYGLYIDKIITTDPDEQENKVGLKVSIKDAGLNIKGKYKLTSQKDFLAKISKLNILLPFYLMKDEETGLVSEVDTTGFNLDIDKVDIDLEVDSILKPILPGLLKIVLRIIKKNIIEAKLIETMNTKLGELFEKVNKIILSGVEPDKLNITIKEQDLSNLRKSSLISAASYLLNNLTGIDGPLNLNKLVNMFTYNTGEIRLHEIYNKSIHFEFNLTNSDNSSLGNFDIGLEDLNISGLNTWKNFSALDPFDNILLNSYTVLKNLTINVTFSIKLILDNSSSLVTEETILYEKANLRTNLHDNILKALLQLPVNKKKLNDYTNKECLSLDCVLDLPDSNGTGITALSLDEIFSYIILEVDRNIEGLEEDVDDTIEKLVSLFIKSFNDKISLLINALLNSTVINLANREINNYLYSTSCPGISDPDDSEINIGMTSIAGVSALGLFSLLIFCPYILGKACGKDVNTIKVNLLDEEKVKENITNISEIKNVKSYDMQSKYCINSISIQWIKEFGRTDPDGASLFLHPKIPMFWRIFIPFAILITAALFISSNSGTGASVFVVFDIGRRIQVPSLFDFGLINSIREMCKAGVYFLALVVALFSGVWPYLKLLLMLISFVLPTSILNKRKRESILMALDATGKWSILDSYVMILMLVAFHFHIQFPLDEKSEIEKGAIINVFVYAAYGFLTLILGTVISLCLSHIITNLNRSLDEHPDQNKGEKAESYTALISFAESKIFSKKNFQVLISFLLILTLCLVIAGSFTTSFSFYFHGLAGYALDLFEIAPQREYSVIQLGFSVPESYENPNDKIIRFTQAIYFITVFIMPISTLLNIMFLWFIPLPRKIQKFLYTIAEILNAWSCLDVFVIAIIAAILQISQFTEFIVGDKCDTINPFIDKYFYDFLNGHNKCFEVQAYLQSGCWILFIAAIMFFILTKIVLKVCRNALDERLPDNVKEYLKRLKEGERISRIAEFNSNDSMSNINSARETLIQLNHNEINNTNNTISANNNNEFLEEDN